MTSVNAPKKSWIFVINHPGVDDAKVVTSWADDANRMVASLEVGESGTEHIQGAVTWKAAKRLTQLKKLHPGAHWEAAIATGSMFLYCKKAGSMLLIDSNNRTQGSRVDIAAAYAAAAAGQPLAEFLTEHQPGYQAIQVYRVAAYALAAPRPIAPIRVIWRWGPSGVGKTRWAHENFPDLYVVPDFKWWDGYTGQKTVLFDDIRGDFCPFHEWLRLLDIYPLQKQFKGGWVHVQYTTAIITCPFPPEVLWMNRGDEELRQLTRRITEVVRVTGL